GHTRQVGRWRVDVPQGVRAVAGDGPQAAAYWWLPAEGIGPVNTVGVVDAVGFGAVHVESAQLISDEELRWRADLGTRGSGADVEDAILLSRGNHRAAAEFVQLRRVAEIHVRVEGRFGEEEVPAVVGRALIDPTDVPIGGVECNERVASAAALGHVL